MIVALTGTPGTGKTTVSKHLEKKDYTVLAINELAKDRGLLSGYDPKRDTHEVDIDGMNEFLNEYVKKFDNATIFLEGHLAHLLDIPELVIILRCHPKELRARLMAKSWMESKIQENLEAEAIDTITIECVNNYEQDKIFEIDTTSETPQEIVDRILAILNNEVNTDDYKPGKIDWSEEILKWY